MQGIQALSPTGWLKVIPRTLGRGIRYVGAQARLERPGPFWLKLDLDRGLAEVSSFRDPWSTTASLGLLEHLLLLEYAASDPQVAGVYLRLGTAAPGLAHLVALRRSLLALKQAGKKVVAFGEDLSLDAYWLGSVADQIWMPRLGTLSILGMRIDQYFVSKVLDRVGVETEFFACRPL